MSRAFTKSLAACGVLCTLVLFPSLTGALAQEHEISPNSAGGSVSLDAFAKRIDGKALDYKQKYAGASIDRIINYDVAFAKDAAEFQTLNGYAVMLVSANAHDQSELPMAKVYLAINGKTAELPVIARTRRTTPADSPTYAEFGPYREDLFVVVPAVFLFLPASFAADFAAHRNGFEFAKGPVNAPTYLAADKSLLSTQIKPSPSTEALKVLIRREYPGFLDN